MSQSFSVSGTISNKSIKIFDKFFTFNLAIYNGKNQNGEYNKSTFMICKVFGGPTEIIKDKAKITILQAYFTTTHNNDKSYLNLICNIEDIVPADFEEDPDYFRTLKIITKSRKNDEECYRLVKEFVKNRQSENL